MKIARFFGWIFGLLGTALMVGAILLCLTQLNEPARVVQVSDGAIACSENFRDAIVQGDFEAAQSLLYGQPQLGFQGEPQALEGILIWDAFRRSIAWEYTGDCYPSGSGLARDAVITVLDIPGTTRGVEQKAREILNSRVQQAEDVMALYDDTGNFREALVAEVLTEAVTQTLVENGKTLTREVTVKLVCRDGQWWAVPEDGLLSAISGGLA